MYSFGCLHLPTLISQTAIIFSFWKIHCFTFFPYKSIRDQIWHWSKVNPGSPFEQTWLQYSSAWCYIPSFNNIGQSKEDFYHIWAWWLSWSCDQDHLSKLSLPHAKKAPCGIWLIGPVVSEKMFEECGRRWWTTDYGRPAYHISLLINLRLRWAKKPERTVEMLANLFSY